MVDHGETAWASAIEPAEDHRATVADLERTLLSSGRTGLRADAKRAVAATFTTLISSARLARTPRGAGDHTKRVMLRAIIGEWSARHGGAADDALMEDLHDLHTEGGTAQVQPMVASCLAHAFATMDWTRSILERRRWLVGLLRRELAARSGKLRILDLACGGARYIADFLAGLTDTEAARVEFVLADQDPAAIQFCHERSLSPRSHQVSARAILIEHLAELVDHARFDVVLCPRLVDPLEEATARSFLGLLSAMLDQEGVLAISNFHSDARQRVLLDRTADGRIVYRSENDVRRLLPLGGEATVTRSSNDALVLATWRRRGREGSSARSLRAVGVPRST